MSRFPAGIDALIWVMRRQYGNPRVLRYACKATREVIRATQEALGDRTEGSRRWVRYFGNTSRPELARAWTTVIDEAVNVMREYPYNGTASRF